MSAENDVPLGDGSRRYYEQMFGDRIRQVAKGGGSAPRQGHKSSTSNGRAGCGVAIAIFVAIRIIAAFMGSRSHQTTYISSPSAPRIVPFPDNGGQDDQAMKRFRQLPQNNKPVQGGPRRLLPEADQNSLLTRDDIPFLEGLCYRLYHESLRSEAKPGKHFMTLMDPDVRPLVIKASRGEIFDRHESDEVLKGLNEVLQHRDFWKHASLARLRELQENSRQQDNAQGIHIPPPGCLEERRLILQVCYPAQIVPLSERNQLGEKARETLREQARRDLEKARRQYEGLKH